MPSTLEHLAAYPPADVERLLRLRPDVLAPPLPRDLRELAERLDDVTSAAAALADATLPTLQAAEAIAALDARATMRTVTALLAGDERGSAAPADVNPVLGWLAERSLIWLSRDADPAIECSPGLVGCFDRPLGLGRPAALLHAGQTAKVLQGVLARLGLPRATSKAEALATLLAWLDDADRVVALSSTAPQTVQRWLLQQCVPLLEAADEAANDGLPSYLLSSSRYREHLEAAQWVADHGLAVPLDWQGSVELPAEVVLAVRGPSYRAPFQPRPPHVPLRPVEVAQVERESAAAATAFAEQSLAVLDLVSRAPLTTMRSGGVGARELARVAKAVGTDVGRVRLALELAGSAGLVLPGADAGRAGPGLASWRDQNPAERFVVLLRAWRSWPGVPTTTHDDSARPVPVLAGAAPCPGCAATRRALLQTLADQPAGSAADLGAVAVRTLWRRPLLHAPSPDGAEPFEPTWREAELLGVVAHGALTDLGRKLLADAGGASSGAVASPDAGTDPLVTAAAALLPPTSDEAVFGGDLTVVVTGAPSGRVTRVLDAVADRESRGGAVVWRITPGSVRRALDAGSTADELAAELLAVSRSGLPQPLRYLLADVGRRHGSLRVRAVASCVRGDDPALVAQAAADRSLRRLGLRQLAPTVLASAADAETTVAALRDAGYLPVTEDAEGDVVLGGGTREGSGAGAAGGARSLPRPGAARPGGGRQSAPPGLAGTGAGTASGNGRTAGAPQPLDLAALAAALVAAGDPGPREPSSMTERLVRREAPQLLPADARLLGHAVDSGTEVVIEYVSASGSRTRRQVGELVVMGSTLQAWCHLRQDDRFFSLSRIERVHPPAGAGILPTG